MPPEQRANATITDPITTAIQGSACLSCHTGQYGVGFDPVAAVAAAKAICMAVQNPTQVPSAEELNRSTPQGQ
jgi:hypothetical protein